MEQLDRACLRRNTAQRQTLIAEHTDSRIATDPSASTNRATKLVRMTCDDYRDQPAFLSFEKKVMNRDQAYAGILSELLVIYLHLIDLEIARGKCLPSPTPITDRDR